VIAVIQRRDHEPDVESDRSYSFFEKKCTRSDVRSELISQFMEKKAGLLHQPLKIAKAAEASAHFG
jgi:hypothetical protein